MATKSVAKQAAKPAKSDKQKLYTNTKSRALFKKAVNVIPAGIPGHLGPVESQFIPVESFPFYAQRAKDSYFWDIDGNKYIDLMCAYGPNVLGYNNKAVNDAALAQLKDGDCMALPGAVQVELADLLCNTIEIAKWAFFLKNGGDATTFAVMIAKAATNRDKIIRLEGGYHGVAPWTQALKAAGVSDTDVVNNIILPFNDVEAVRNAIKQNEGKIAAFIATPYDHRIFADNQLPIEGYWQEIRKLCSENGIVLIVDDVRCGFRLSIKGSAHYFGFKPDLACYCKALANGYNISAVVGSEDFRQAATKVFYTGSYWSSAMPMAAAVACIKELKRLKGDKLMLQKGKKLCDGLVKTASSHGIDFKVSGAESMPYFRITNDDSLLMHQRWCEQMVRRGVFVVSHHNHFINCSLTDDDIKRIIQISDEAFSIVAKENPSKLLK